MTVAKTIRDRTKRFEAIMSQYNNGDPNPVLESLTMFEQVTDHSAYIKRLEGEVQRLREQVASLEQENRDQAVQIDELHLKKQRKQVMGDTALVYLRLLNEANIHGLFWQTPGSLHLNAQKRQQYTLKTAYSGALTQLVGWGFVEKNGVNYRITPKGTEWLKKLDKKP